MKLIYFTLTKSAGLLAEMLSRTYPGEIVTRESLRGAPTGGANGTEPAGEACGMTPTGGANGAEPAGEACGMVSADETCGMTTAGEYCGLASAGEACGMAPTDKARPTAFSHAVADAWNRYDGLVFIMASGIVVRTIAPLLKSKTSDPAVIVMDSDGRFVISLLSGHLGGANALAGALAKVSGGQAVITTGTDVAGTLAFDVLAKENHCLIENIKELKYISGAMIERLSVDVYCPYPVRFQMPENVRLYTGDTYTGDTYVGDIYTGDTYANATNVDKCAGGIINSGATSNTKVSAASAVIIGHKFTFESLETEITYKNVLYLRPKNLCIGVGCKRNISFQAMEDAFVRFMELNRIIPGEVAGLATIALKKDEPAILQLAKKYGLPLHIIEDEAIKALEKNGAVSTSEFVKKTTGVGAVSEGSALALAERLATASDRAVLIRPKTKYDGITFALAECCRHLISGSRSE